MVLRKSVAEVKADEGAVRKTKDGCGLCDYRAVSLDFLREFGKRVSTEELALNVKLFVLSTDYEPEEFPGVVLRQGTTVMRKQKKSDGSYVMTMPNLGEMQIDSSLVHSKDRLDWDMADVVEYIIKRNSMLMRDKLTFNEIIANKHPHALGKKFQGTYVVHSRTTKLTSLLHALEVHFRGRQQMRKAYIWLDEFGCNQNYTKEDEDAEANAELRKMKSVFIEGEQLVAMKRFGDCVLYVPSLEDMQPLERLWCLWELYGVALHSVKFNVAYSSNKSENVQIDALQWLDNFEKVLNSVQEIDVTRANYLVKEDHEIITKAIHAAGDAPKVNTMIRNLFFEWMHKSVTDVTEAYKSSLKKGKVDQVVQIAKLIEFQAILLQESKKPAQAIAGKLKELVLIQKKFLTGENPEMKRIKRSVATIVLDSSPNIQRQRLTSDINQKAKRPVHTSGLENESKTFGDTKISISESFAQSGKLKKQRKDSVKSTKSSKSAKSSKSNGSFARKMSLFVYTPKAFKRKVPTVNETELELEATMVDMEEEDPEEVVGRVISSQDLLTKAREEGSTVTAKDLTTKGDELVKLGHKAESIEMFQEALQILSKTVEHTKESRELQIRTLRALADVVAQKGAFGTAIDRLDDALKIYTDNEDLEFENSELAVADMFVKKGQLCCKQDELDDSIAALSAASEILSKLDTEEAKAKLALTEKETGLVLSMQGNGKAALRKLGDAIEHFRICHGDEHEEIADVLHDMAIIAAHMGRSKEALAFEHEAYIMWKSVLGPTSSKIGDALNDFAVMLDELGEHKGALINYKEALDVFIGGFGENHCRVADTYYNIGGVLHGMKNFTAAMEHYESALHIYNHNDHAHAALTLTNIAVILETQGALDEAYCATKDALNIFERKFGDDHPQTLKVKKKLKRIGRRRFAKHSKGISDRQTQDGSQSARSRRPSAMQKFRSIAFSRSSKSVKKG